MSIHSVYTLCIDTPPQEESIQGWGRGERQHALLDTAPYIGDSPALNLPWIIDGTGKEAGGHDWQRLDKDTAIANICAQMGKITMLVALAWGRGLPRLYRFYLLTKGAGIRRRGESPTPPPIPDLPEGM